MQEKKYSLLWTVAILCGGLIALVGCGRKIKAVQVSGNPISSVPQSGSANQTLTINEASYSLFSDGSGGLLIMNLGFDSQKADLSLVVSPDEEAVDTQTVGNVQFTIQSKCGLPDCSEFALLVNAQNSADKSQNQMAILYGGSSGALVVKNKIDNSHFTDAQQAIAQLYPSP